MQLTKTELLPQWSRIIHRLHSLGKMRIEYSNRIANLSQLGYYPRYIPSSSEDKSKSIDGSVMWNFLNWEQGFVKQENEELSLEFKSRGLYTFHKLNVVGDTDTECLSCLLKLFGCEGQLARELPPVIASQKANHRMKHGLACLLEKCVDKKYYQHGVGVGLFTEGGVISKHLHFKEISCRDGFVNLKADRGYELSVAQAEIEEVKTVRTSAGIESTVMNERGMPLIVVKMPA